MSRLTTRENGIHGIRISSPSTSSDPTFGMIPGNLVQPDAQCSGKQISECYGHRPKHSDGAHDWFLVRLEHIFPNATVVFGGCIQPIQRLNHKANGLTWSRPEIVLHLWISRKPVHKHSHLPGLDP